MHFEDNPQEAAFRAEARAWLADHARPKSGSSTGAISFHDKPLDDEAGWVSSCREWQATKQRGGYAAIRWPREWGGAGRSLVEDVIFTEEEVAYDVAVGAFGITLGMVFPTLATHGPPGTERHLDAILRGDEIWCQLFSEPGAGSDLAAVSTKAVADGDSWVVSGQKVWISGAQYADWGYLLTRTSTEGSKHDGMTAFMMPMSAPGVEVRPLRQMTGTALFNEVYLDDVRIPDSDRLGEVGAGWKVAITTLMNERFHAGGVANAQRMFELVRDEVRRRNLGGDPVTRQRVADLYARMEIHRLTNCRALTALSQGRAPGPEGSLSKMLAGAVSRTTGRLASQVLGADLLNDPDWSRFILGIPGASLGGGTDEIMRNIIGERVLGLPREPAPRL